MVYKVSRIVFSTICLVTSSCSTMINPYVKIEERPNSHPVQLNLAINYANKGKDNYSEALGEQAEFNSYLGIGLTALGASALGLGVVGTGSTTAITVLGLTGASAYGIGSFLENKPRQRAYILGYNAINCAVEAVLPLNVNSSQSYNHFSQALHGGDTEESLLSHIENTEKAISKVRQITTTPSISRSISAAESLVGTAKIAYSNGVNLDLKINNSGNALTSAVDRIVGQVNDSINTNQADLQSIMTIIGGLGSMYSQFTMIPQSTTSTSDIKSAKEAVIQSADLSQQTLNELLNSAAELSKTTQIVTAFVNAIVAEKPIEQLKICGVNPDDIASSIEIDPAGVINFTQGKGGSVGRIIQGGTSPYNAAIISSSAKGISVKQSIPFAPMFVVEATPEAEVGDYSIYVTDGSGNRKFVTVRVINITTNVMITDPINKSCSPPPEAWTNVSDNEQKKIQQSLCTTDDGIWGCKTLEKLKQFKTDNKLSDDSIAIANLLKLTDEEKQKKCATIPTVSGVNSLIKQVEILNNGIAFTMDGLVIIISKATLNEAEKVIDLQLDLDKNPSKEISKQELIDAIIKRPSISLESKDVNITNFEGIKANLKPAS